MSIINGVVYSDRKEYMFALHYKILLAKRLYIFYRELQLKSLEYDFFDDIYPSILKLQASPSKGFLLNIYFYCKSLCNKVYGKIRLWCIRV
jgi:hypothetical protein